MSPRRHLSRAGVLAGAVLLALPGPGAVIAAELGSHPYASFETPETCAECHVSIARQHEQALMSQSFTHHWDEIEYFALAYPHSQRSPKVAEIEAGCNGCHAPLAFLAGDIPPARPSEETRANEGVSCDLCHSITGFEGDTPFNFNWIVQPGETKYGTRGGGESAFHEIERNDFLGTAEFCGTCHNERDPFGQWVKATHLEWKESPYADAGIVCQDCHMPPAAGPSVEDGDAHPDVRQHLFHGAHDPGKLSGSIEVRIHPEVRAARGGETMRLVATVVNAKAGHMIPSGSAEERVVWLHVTATDAAGTVHHLPVDRRGFEGEDYTIASSESLAYQDIGFIQGLASFTGLARDGNVPDGDRIYRLPYLDPDGRMTIAQWNTASFGPDYRLAPLEGRNETFTWTLPVGIPAGPIEVRAEVYYSRLVSSVAEYLGVPAEESEPILVASHVTAFEAR